MSTLSLRLPESLHKRLKEMAQREGISINQFISTAVAEKLSALMTVQYLQERRPGTVRCGAGEDRRRPGRRSGPDRGTTPPAPTAKLNAPPALGVRGLDRFPG